MLVQASSVVCSLCLNSHFGKVNSSVKTHKRETALFSNRERVGMNMLSV